MKIFVLGYPSDIGGANTELWHCLRLWREVGGLDVTLIPTWQMPDARQLARVEQIGCRTVLSSSENLHKTPGLLGSTVVSFCNKEFLQEAAKTLRDAGCRLVWASCMTFVYDYEARFLHDGLSVQVFQSEYQRSRVHARMQSLCIGTPPYVITGSPISFDEFPYRPLERRSRDAQFVIGRMSRPDLDKWLDNTWEVYDRVQFPDKRVMLLGANERTREKLGEAPSYGQYLMPGEMPVRRFLSKLHCLMPLNGGAVENWPRVGLEAMSSGVPIVAQDEGGWREMIEDGETGLLGFSDQELAHKAATLAWDEKYRMQVARRASERLRDELAKTELMWENWQRVFDLALKNESICRSEQRVSRLCQPSDEGLVVTVDKGS